MSKFKKVFFLCVCCAAGAIGSRAQTFTTLLDFDFTNGCYSYADLVQGLDGRFYGTTAAGGANGGGTIFKITAGGMLTTLYTFPGYPEEYVPGPHARLVQASGGNFYGTTYEGGYGVGTVFKITPRGNLTFLHSFDGTDGGLPAAGLVQGTDGNFYGTTAEGGAIGDGTIFKITPGGTLTTLHSFGGTGSGAFPAAGLVQGTDGNFYGTTQETVFKITPGGTLTTLQTFGSTAGLVQGTDGNFYGTTFGGGADDYGTVFKITPGGTLTTLHSFDRTDGSFPAAGLVQATDGNFYGTTYEGGADDYGTVFKITPEGTLTTLHSFDNTDGSSPLAGLVQGTDGNFYGTATNGGCGTVFSLSVGLGPFVETLPTSGKVGTAVAILGNNLTGVTSVTFNGTSAKFNVVSSTEIMTKVPHGATTGNVKVNTPHGMLTSNVNFRVR